MSSPGSNYTRRRAAQVALLQELWPKYAGQRGGSLLVAPARQMLSMCADSLEEVYYSLELLQARVEGGKIDAPLTYFLAMLRKVRDSRPAAPAPSPVSPAPASPEFDEARVGVLRQMTAEERAEMSYYAEIADAMPAKLLEEAKRAVQR